tara:strand:- start:488 stop:1195 length:708 start_codon:yes stop_codon:yes gene_type:complete
MNKFEIFFNIDIKNFKLNIFIIDTINENIILTKDFKFDKFQDSNFLIIDKIGNILKKVILEIEKHLDTSISKINLMVEQENSYNIELSIKTNFENKIIDKKNIEYLIQDLRQQLLTNYPDKKFIHILVKKCIIDSDEYNTIPIGNKCKNFIIELSFIHIPKKLLNGLEGLFNEHQMFVNKVICTNYAKTLIVTEVDNLSKAGLNILRGSNLNEIGIIPKKVKKIGFFEKLFHIFS